MEDITYKYDAFISYRHYPKDMKIAQKLQKMLEGDIIPAKSGIEKRRLRICRDENEFSVGSNLYEEIYVKLRQSKFLIVVCGSETRESPFCMEEIRYFKKIHHGRLDKVLVLLIEGDSAQALPEELTYETIEARKLGGSICLEKHTVKPLYCNIRAKSEHESMQLLKNEFLKLAAPLLGCDYEDLFQRYLRRRMKRKITGITVCIAVISIICVLSYAAWISRKSQALVYEYTAKDCIEDGKWSQALLYYGKALELDPRRTPSRIGAMLLMQQHTWPCLETEEEFMGICGTHIHPVFYPGESIDSFKYSCVSMTPSGEYMLWGDLNDNYIVTDGKGNALYALEGKGNAWTEEAASGWLFYNPEKRLFTFHWPKEGKEYELYWPGEHNDFPGRSCACILAKNQAAVNDNQNLYLYKLDSRGNKEINCIALDDIFGKRPAVNKEEAWKQVDALPGVPHQKLAVNKEEAWEQVDRQNMRASSDGEILAVSEVVTHGEGQNVSVSSKTALFDTKDMKLLTIISNDKYALEKVVFSDHGEYISLLYNNSINSFLAPGGMAGVYTKSGKELIKTEEDHLFLPRDAVFCDDSFLVWDYNTIHFWDIDSAKEFAVPITTPEAVQGVTKTKDRRYAVQWLLGIHYYNLVSFRDEQPPDLPSNEMAAQADISLDEPNLLTDRLYVYLQDDRTVVLSDEDGNPYDVFSFHDEDMQTVVSVFYLPSVETLFVIDEEDSLYGIPILTDKKKFMDADETCIASFVGSVCGAKDGILVWCYLTNLIQYYTRDTFDRFPQYFGWEAGQENAGIFLGMCDNDKYAVFVVQDEKNERYIAEIRDMKNGNYINEFALDNEFSVSAMFFNEAGELSYSQKDEWTNLKIDAPLPDPKAVRQLISLSGCTLDENQAVISSGAIVDLNNFGNWTGIFR